MIDLRQKNESNNLKQSHHKPRNLRYFIIIFLSICFCYVMLEILTSKDPESILFNKKIRELLAKGQDVELSDLLKYNNDISLLVFPPYAYIGDQNAWNCEGYNYEF